MRLQNFYDWLIEEVITSQMTLLNLYEKRDRMLYMEAPELKKQYMALFGEAEEPVMRAELELALLQRKLELVQTAVNRREAVDMAAIETRLEEEKQRMIQEAEKNDITLQGFPKLSDEQKMNMQKQYREIMDKYHPMMHPGMTSVQKMLYDKAVEAYKMQDADAINLIHEQLCHFGELYVRLSFRILHGTEAQKYEYKKISEELSTDYSLAGELYDCFIPLEGDAVIQENVRKYERELEKVQAEILGIQKSFPFSAAETMNDQTKSDEYLAELRVRVRQCEKKKSELEQQIADLIRRNHHD